MRKPMNPDDFTKAVDIATRYLVLSGIEDISYLRSVGRHVLDLFEEGESRPLMLANRAIDRMLLQLEAEWELDSEPLEVVFHDAS